MKCFKFHRYTVLALFPEILHFNIKKYEMYNFDKIMFKVFNPSNLQ